MELAAKKHPNSISSSSRRSKSVDTMTMTRMHKLIVALLLSAVGELVLPGFAEITNAHEIVSVEENGRWAEIELTRASLALVRLVPVTSEGETVGIIAIYDNPTTPRPDDYLELRDDGGQIVAIGWFDRFGVRRLTLDRGFLEGKGKFERIFVTLVSGESM
jgi:hypothetical protein